MSKLAVLVTFRARLFPRAFSFPAEVMITSKILNMPLYANYIRARMYVCAVRHEFLRNM